ncbi:hypothetical protein [Peribacillus frigoritolerans]|uniref:hypothetical protein n=1 Tax=Peribacillus frigoritolerans TaxID=450367 RepID=UPI00207AD189|nr:hypothetical protein [Peribacillus frigoritolerans]USK75909.1 hypothetical protein LIT31_04890 [Peribacillus frigoritolerans]
MNTVSVKNLSVDDLKELTNLLNESSFQEDINIIESKGFGGFVECIIFLGEVFTTLTVINEFITIVTGWTSKRPNVEIEVNGIKVLVKNEQQAAHLIKLLQENPSHES